MEQAAKDTLDVLLRQSREELQGTARADPRLLSQLDALERLLEAGTVTRDTLEVTAALLRGFLASRTVRGPAALREPLPATRSLDDWIRNNLIRFDNPVRPGEASQPVASADSPPSVPTGNTRKLFK